MNVGTESDETPVDVVIDAAFMESILETDLANIVKKATNGQPLSKREREMIEAEQTRLSKKSDAGFKLEGEGPATALEGMTQQELAEEWGYSLRTIKGWLAEGRAKNDPCPLSRPGEMPGWFLRVHAPRLVPDKLRDAVARVVAGEKARSEVVSAAVTPVAPKARVVIPDEQKGFLAMLNRYRDAEPTLHGKYMDAIESGDESKAGFYMREWSIMGEKLRALEKIAPETLEKLGIYVKKDEVMRELEPLHRAIIKAFRQGLRSGRPRLKSAQTGDEWNRIVDSLVDEVSQMLVDTDFAEPLELVAA